MEHKAPYAFVGFFVCLCIAAMVGFTVWMQGSHEKDYVPYTILMPDSVSGLEEGAQVLYRGIRVGKVEKLRLPPEGDDEVRVDIRIRNDVPVHKTTHAELARMSITGVVNLNITAPEANDAEPPLQVAGEPNPIIEGRKSPLENALKDVPAITSQLRSVTGKLNQGIDNFQGSFVGKIMGQKKPEDKKEGPQTNAPKPQSRSMNLRN